MKVNNLATRTLSGAIFVAIVVGATLLSPWSFAALLIVVGVGCIRELRRLTSRAQWIVLSLLYVVVPLTMLGAMPLLVALIAWLWEVVLKEQVEGGRLWRLMALFPLFLMVMVWANDTFAYLVGVACGKHKMAPHLSPKKSWEGFAGGLAATIGIGVLAMHLLESSLLWGGGLGLFVGVGAVAGDLFESRLKRRAGVKDSGNILPGHGGFLDRFDSLLFAVPATFIYVVLISLFWE